MMRYTKPFDKEDDPVEYTGKTNSDPLDDRRGHSHHHHNLDEEGAETDTIIELEEELSEE